MARRAWVSITTSEEPSTSGNQGVSPGANAGVESVATNKVASFLPTR